METRLKQPAECVRGRSRSVAWVLLGWAPVLCVGLVSGLPAHAQNIGQIHSGFPQPAGPSLGGGVNDIPDDGSIDHEKLLRTLNAERQKSLVADTNKLVRLVKELNDDIARTKPQQLSDEQLRKLAEIEKLAHNVKEKMSTSVRGTPSFTAPFQPPI
jgi:hypothetical protein